MPFIDKRDPVEHHDTECVKSSDKALWIEFKALPRHPRMWVPKSQINEASEVQELGDEGALVVSAWFSGMIETELATKVSSFVASARSRIYGTPDKPSGERKGRFSKKVWK